MPTLLNYKKPSGLSLSGNPIVYGYTIDPYTEGDTYSGTVIKVTLSVLKDGSYNEVKRYTLNPDKDGNAEIDIHSVIDRYLKFNTPNPSQNEITLAKDQSLRYKLDAEVVNNYDVISDNITSYGETVKGTAPMYMGDSPELLIQKYNNKEYLRYWYDGEQINIAEDKWLYVYLPGINASAIKFGGDIFFSINAFYSDGSIDVYSYTKAGAKAYEVYSIPIGISQLNIPTIKDIAYLTKIKCNCQFFVAGTSYFVIADCTFYVNHDRHNTVGSLYWHNGLGGFESVILTEIETALSKSNTSYRSIETNVWKERNVLEANTTVYGTRYRDNFSAATRWLDKEEIERMRDLLISEQVYIKKQNRFYPVQLTDEQYDLYNTEDGLYSLALDYAGAMEHIGYIPETEMIVCPPPIYGYVKQIYSKMFEVFYQLGNNSFNGELAIAPSNNVALATISPLMNNKDSVRMSVPTGYTLDPTTQAYKVNIWIRGKCEESVSEWLYLGEQLIKNVMAPLALNLYSNAEKGGSDMVLTWQNGSSYYDTIFKVMSDEPSWIVRLLFSTGGATTGTGTAGGTFTLSSNEILYTPVNSDFVGTDTISAYVSTWAGGVRKSDWSNIKIYVHVSGDGTAVVPVGLGGLFVKLEWVGEPINLPLHFAISYRVLRVNYYQDPLGIVPKDLTGSGITLNVIGDNFTTYTHTYNVIASGTNNSIGPVMIKYGSDVVDWVIEASPEFTIIY